MGAEGFVIDYEQTIDEVRWESSKCADCTNLAFERPSVDCVTPVKAGGGREMFPVDVGAAGGYGAAVDGEIWRSIGR